MGGLVSRQAGQTGWLDGLGVAACVVSGGRIPRADREPQAASRLPLQSG